MSDDDDIKLVPGRLWFVYIGCLFGCAVSVLVAFLTEIIWMLVVAGLFSIVAGWTGLAAKVTVFRNRDAAESSDPSELEIVVYNGVLIFAGIGAIVLAAQCLFEGRTGG